MFRDLPGFAAKIGEVLKRVQHDICFYTSKFMRGSLNTY